MKILFQSRLDLFDKKGGDTVQMLETKASLEKLGVSVDIDCSLNKDLKGYDLVHIFNLDWVCETYSQVINAKKQGKKVVLSPIHHSSREFERYENESRFGLMRLGNFLITNQPLREEARNVLKGFLYPQKLKPAIKQVLMGIRNQQRKCLELADFVLVQTNLEARDLEEDFEVRGFKWKKVVNGIAEDKFGAQKSPTRGGAGKTILCVGRVEPRKNQLNLIKAFESVSEDNVQLVFVGGLNKNHPSYIKKFLSEVSSSQGKIEYEGFISQDKLCEFYSKADVFAVSSWFETTGLVYLEAVVCGIKSIVAVGERAKEYLEDNACYCDSGSVESIAHALKLSLQNKTVKTGFADFVKKTYNWEECAKQTVEVYEKILEV